jgi:anti-anti-sigma factor
VEFSTISHADEKRIALSGQFTFTDNQRFKQIIESLNEPQLKTVVIDFSGVEFIDSAGLGMLLLLRDTCQEKKLSLEIHSAHGQVEKIFMISKFDQLFSMRT